MAVLLMTGDHPRHGYLAHCLHDADLLRAWVIERREPVMPKPPPGLPARLEALFERHFSERRLAEVRHLVSETTQFAGVPTIEVDAAGLNGDRVTAFLAAHPAAVLLTYGVHILAESTLAAARVNYRWNLHGGLSPWYRGCITHFWPSYLLQPQMTGCTVHELTSALDHGPVVHQSVAELVRGDGLHDLSCRAVRRAADEMSQLIDAARRRDVRSVAHRTTGRLWRASDWRPEHLELVYTHYGNRIVDRYLDGEFMQATPKLVRQW